MAHAAVRIMLIPDIVNMICKKYDMTEKEALDSFYTSAVGREFADDDSGLYGQSALYVFGLYCMEREYVKSGDRSVLFL